MFLIESNHSQSGEQITHNYIHVTFFGIPAKEESRKLTFSTVEYLSKCKRELGLDVEFKMNHITVFHGIVFAFKA